MHCLHALLACTLCMHIFGALFEGYHNWRRHQAHGARGDVHDVFTQEETPYLTQQVVLFVFLSFNSTTKPFSF